MTGIPQLTATTLADQAYTTLRQAILDGALARGQKITERGLAEMLNISATPVREAMRRLEQDRLIERHGPRSVTVAAFDDAEKADVAIIESTLHALAARLAATRATDSDRRRMEATLDAADEERDALFARKKLSDRELQAGVDRVWTHMRTFHEIVDQASHSPMLLHLLRTAAAFDSTERHEFLPEELRANREAIDERYRHHRAIFGAILSHEDVRAEQVMLRHNNESAQPHQT